MNLNSLESNLKFNHRDLAIFILPILIFSLYLFVYNPGVLTATSYNQLHQIATGKFTTACPIFHTLLVMLCLKIFKQPIFIGVFQILIFSTMWMVICKYHRDDLSNSNQYFLQFILTFIICLIPINAVYSVTLSSNVLFSYSLLFLSFLIKIMVDKNGQIDTKFLIAIAVTLAIIIGLNNYGIFIALLSLISIIYYLSKKNLSRNTLKTFIGLTILLLLAVGSLNFIADVQDDSSNIHANDAFEEGINLESARNQFFSSINGKPVEEFENVTSVNIGNSKYNLVDSFVNQFRENFILNLIFNNAIISMIFTIILLVLISFITLSKEIYLVFIPTFLNTITALFIGQNNLYSNLLVFYMTTLIFINIYFKQNSEPSDLTKITSKTEKQETLKTQPQHYSEESYPEENYYSGLDIELSNVELDEIEEMLYDEDMQLTETQEESSSDLIDEILKEIENKNK